MSAIRLHSQALLARPVAQASQVAGRLCLDFTNAVGGWMPQKSASGGLQFTVRDDRLRDYEDLVAWALRAQILDEAQSLSLIREASRDPRAATAVWQRGVRLRSAIHDVAASFERVGAPGNDDLEILAREAAVAREGQRLLKGATNLEWRLPEKPLPLDAPLALVALSAEDYFTRGDLSRLHSCAGTECGWLFEDTTRNRSRRWCDMGDCGNLAKVKKFRARQAKAVSERGRR